MPARPIEPGDDRPLLHRQRDREFAVADASRQALDELGDGVLAIGADQFGQRVMWQGELLTPATGEPVRFQETLKA